jgi:hypothetical protein
MAVRWFVLAFYFGSFGRLAPSSTKESLLLSPKCAQRGLATRSGGPEVRNVNRRALLGDSFARIGLFPAQERLTASGNVLFGGVGANGAASQTTTAGTPEP